MEVHAISSPGDDLSTLGAREGIAVHPVEMPRLITPLGDLRAVWQIYRVLRKIRPAIVHAHTPKGGLLGTIAAWLARVPVRIYHVRGLPLMTATGPKRRILRLTERTACALAHRVLCVSHSLRAVVVAEGLCPPEKIRVLLSGSGNGVDAGGRFDPRRLPERAGEEIRSNCGIPESAKVIGFVGRIVRDKGIVELASAWLALREEFAELHLLIVGPFEPQDPVPEETAATLRDDPRVHLVGMDWDTPPLYAAMDLLVLPTYREGFPNVPLEAASMGLPVVATRVPGCVDAVQDGVTGILVPARDDVALANAIRNYLLQPRLRRDHGRAGRERVLSAFRQGAIWDALHQEYSSLLRLNGRGVSAGTRGHGADSPDSSLREVG